MVLACVESDGFELDLVPIPPINDPVPARLKWRLDSRGRLINWATKRAIVMSNPGESVMSRHPCGGDRFEFQESMSISAAMDKYMHLKGNQEGI
jgi:hypothetical protein